MQLLQGISIDIKLNVWKKIADVILKLMENGQLPEELFPILGGVAPAFLLRVNANLDITVDEHMKAKIAENPLVEPVLMDAKTLIDSISGNSFENDGELDAFIDSAFEGPLPALIKLLYKHLGDEIDFAAVSP